VKSAKRPPPPPPPPPLGEDSYGDIVTRDSDDVWSSDEFEPTEAAPIEDGPPTDGSRRAQIVQPKPAVRPSGEYEGINLPIEIAEGTDETTSRMAQLVKDEMSELRHLEIEPPTEAVDKTRSKDHERLPFEEFQESASIRPTLRQRLVADLYKEAGKAKKL
jgi:hypothetical protein